jgi:hypothetical protein
MINDLSTFTSHRYKVCGNETVVPVDPATCPVGTKLVVFKLPSDNLPNGRLDLVTITRHGVLFDTASGSRTYARFSMTDRIVGIDPKLVKAGKTPKAKAKKAKTTA